MTDVHHLSLPPVHGLDLAPGRGADQLREVLALLFEDPTPLVGPLGAVLPLGSWTELLDRIELIVGELDQPDQILLLAAHPRLGERPETVATASSLSSREQEELGEDPGGLVWLVYFNAFYEQRFGFRCVEFVDGRRARDLIGVLEERLWHERSAELEAGLRAVMAIARDRLDRLSKERQ